MKRFAAHHIYQPGHDCFPLSYVEIDDENRLQAINPLEKEIFSTSFFNGIILIVNAIDSITPEEIRDRLKYIHEHPPQAISFVELITQLPLLPVLTSDTIKLYHFENVHINNSTSYLPREITD